MAAQDNFLQLLWPATRGTPRTPENSSTTELGRRLVFFVELENVRGCISLAIRKRVHVADDLLERRDFDDVAEELVYLGIVFSAFRATMAAGPHHVRGLIPRSFAPESMLVRRRERPWPSLARSLKKCMPR